MSPIRERSAGRVESGRRPAAANTTVESRLAELLLDRVKLWQSAPNAGDESERFRSALAALITAHLELLKDWTDAVLAGARTPQRDLALELGLWLRKRNQFIAIDGAELARFETFFQELFAELRELLALEPEQRAARLRSLDEKLGAFVRCLPPGAELEVPSATYSASLQLEVLGLDASRLEQPVLDLGCGNPPRLLQFLRERGLDAVGIDRDAAEGVLAADWLEHDFTPSSWGSIVSHHAFSLHFLHHHLAPGPAAAAYAKKYMELLRSLRPSGTFAYVPGLPFIERLLPEGEYRLSRHSIGAALAEGLAPFARALGESVSYSARVERLSGA